MKKIIFITILFCSLFVGASYAQDNEMLVPIKTTCVVDTMKCDLATRWMVIDTTFADSLKFTIYSNNGSSEFAYPITRVSHNGNKCVYHCNPRGNKESACLTIYTEAYHYNVYQNNGEPICCQYTERYAVMRRRTSFGYMEYKFQLD